MTTIGALITKHYAAMHSFARRLTWGTDLADDVVQSACVLALSSTIDPDTIDAPRSWLNQCVRHAYYTAMKKIIGPAKRTRTIVVEFAVDGAQEATVALRETLAMVDQLLPRHRELVLLSAAGWRDFELAEMFGTSRQAIGQSLQRAREHLRAA
jgi:RNA polymerase sigma factor (sigma-70 family)